MTPSTRAYAAVLLADPGEEDPRVIARAQLLAFGLLDLADVAAVARAYGK